MFKDRFIEFTYLEKRKDIIKLISQNTECILDSGCGTGNFETLFSLNQSNMNTKIVGIDMSRKRLDVAKSGPYQMASFICGDTESLPFKDNSFDCVILIEVIEHVPNKRRLLLECKRVLKTHGMLIMTTPNKENIVLKVHNILIDFQMRCVGRKSVHKDEYLDIGSISELVETSGLNINEQTIKYLIPLSLSFHNKTYGIIPPLPPSLNIKLLKFLFKIEKKYSIPMFIQRRFKWTIFVCAEKQDNFNRMSEGD